MAELWAGECPANMFGGPTPPRGPSCVMRRRPRVVAELREAVAKAVSELPAKDPKMAGRIIGTIKKQFGDRADAQLVKKLADELLSS